MGEGMSYREMAKELAETEEELETLRVDEEVEKLNGEKTNLRRELEALTIWMSEELEARRKAEDQIQDKEHEIFKIKPHKITKEAIHAVTGFYSTGEVPLLSILKATINTAYQMVKENVDCDLEGALRSQLMANLEAVKKDKKERIPTKVVKRYENSIYFMVDMDTCMIEVVIPRTTWILPIGYEVDKDLLIAYADHFLDQLVDTSTERFGKFKEKLLQVHFELQRIVIEKKMRKEVEAYAKHVEFTKEQIAAARAKHEAEQSGTSSGPIGTSTGKLVEPLVVPAQTDIRKKEKAHKPVTDVEEIESKEDKRALRASDKKQKTTGKGKASKKLFTLEDYFSRMLRIIKEYGIYKGLNTLFVHLSESQQREIEDAVVFSMNKYSTSLIELQGEIPDSLYNLIDARWQATISLNKEFINYTLEHLQLKATEEEIEQIKVNTKALFRSMKRLTRIIIRETESVQKETDILMKNALSLIPDEEEDKDEEIEDDTPVKPKYKELPEGVMIIDFEPDNKYMQDDHIDTEQKDKIDKEEEALVKEQIVQNPPSVKDITNEEKIEKDKEEEKKTEKVEEERGTE
ncbi:uncharacterized protein LOC131079291 [Cryptomeria japonica]|uniref:uncharacterized protein LOC131079291 n=1 Tax=Cryptomeria japonica TaxID=3369 RepID=UPI0025AD0F99|nr:uncharacterized protein LOC131079291 [Cryptomeria japonica]